MGLLIFYVCLALSVSFVCSVLEAVLLSVTPAYVATEIEAGTRAGRGLEQLKQDIDQPLIAILSLNTIAHTVGAAGAGAQAATVFGDAFLGLASGVLTLLILIVSEIIPKTLGAVYWRQLAPLVTRILGPLTWSMWPLIVLAQFITRPMSADKEDYSVRRDEIAAIAELGEQQGVLDSHETQILRNLMQAESLQARDVMTPRTVMYALSEELSVGDVMRLHGDVGFSRIPVYLGGKEQFTGYVLKDELFLEAARDHHDRRLSEMRRTVIAVPDTLSLAKVMEQLLARKEYLALVVDEYGDLEGLLTMEDIVETMLGLEILDESDTHVDMQQYARQQWEARARRLGIQLGEETEARPLLPGGGLPRGIRRD